MADDAENAAKKGYHTLLGDFTEKDGVYVSSTVRPEDLVIPAQFSKTGKDQPLELNRNTVVYTEKEAALGEAFENKIDKDAVLKDNSSAYLNNLSLIATFTASSGKVYDGKMVDGITLARGGLADTTSGPSAIQTNDRGSGLLQMTTQDPAAYLQDFIGIDLKNTNIQPAYIGAWAASVAAHELYHLKDPNLATQTVLGGEIEADHGSLTATFNKDYKDFVMDMQALRSINFIAPQDDHATHIWTEEYASGVMPSEKQANEIMKAPFEIQRIAVAKLRETDPSLSATDAVNIMADPATKYGCLKALNEQGAFKDKPYAMEFVDKFVTAAERRYTPEYLATSNLDGFRKDFAPAVKPEIQIASGPAAPQPVM